MTATFSSECKGELRQLQSEVTFKESNVWICDETGNMYYRMPGQSSGDNDYWGVMYPQKGNDATDG